MIVLQKIIERVKILQPVRLENDIQTGKDFAYQVVIDLMESFLPAEEQQIRDAFEAGKSRRDFERDRNPPPGLFIPNANDYITNLKTK